MQRVVVVGGGLAGAHSAAQLREQGFAGEVVLLGAEPHLPYDRPPLSKELLAGTVEDTTLDLDWAALDVDLRLGVRATGLRPGTVETDGGDLDWDGLVVACGSVPRRLAAAPDALALRTVDDARRLRARLRRGARVVVVGAGWVGAEVATAAAAAGCAVTVVEAAPAPLAGALGVELGRATVPWYAAAGVDLRTGTTVAGVEPGAVLLDGGEQLAADVVLVGIGAVPDTGWLDGSGLEVDRGVLVDAHLAASWPGVVAVGDCAAWESRRFGTRLRVEHWDDALQGPQTAVATLLGADAVHDPVPYFWSHQLGHLVQHAGHAPVGATVVRRGEPGDPAGWSACWLDGGRLVAVLAVDRPKDLLQGRRRIADGAEPDPARLADPAVPLRSL